MENFTLEVDGEGIALVTFEMPGKSLNIISQSVMADLGKLAERLRSDPAIVGAVLRSGKPGGLCTGADLAEMADDIGRWRTAQSQDELRAGVTQAGAYSQRLRALETCGKPIAVIVHGMALGGGFELALACHHRIAVDTPALRLALPETSIGLMPGAGATQRLTRILGLNAALPHLLDGTPIPLADALDSGVIHAIAPDLSSAAEQGRNWILAAGDAVAPWDVKGFRFPGGGPHTSDGYNGFGPAMAARLSEGAIAPGIANSLKAVYEGSQVPIDAGLRIESRYFFNTARSPEARAAVDEFLARRERKGTTPA